MKRVLYSLVCILLVISFSGCSTEALINAVYNELNKPSDEAVAIYGGKWELSYIQKDGLKYNANDLDLSSGIIISAEFNNDGTVVVGISDGTSIEGKWKQSESGVIIDDLEMTCVGEELYLKLEDDALIFEKSSNRSSSKNSLTENETSSSFGEYLSDYYGTWKIEYVVINGIMAEVVDAEVAGCDNIFFTLKKNNVAYVKWNSQSINTTWSQKAHGITIGQEVLFLSGKKLYLNRDDGNKLYFSKELGSKNSDEHVENNDDEIRPEFKKMMDQYEEFFDEYIAFMENYTNESNDNPMAVLGMLQDYLDWLEKYNEVIEEFESVGDSDMTTAEARYYAEVSLRIEKKLLAVLY